MTEFIKLHLFEIIGIIVVLLVISILSVPMIYMATRGELLFSGLYSKRALIFSIGNAAIVTVILTIAAFFFGVTIPDESAGSGLMLLLKVALSFGLIYGSFFPYLIMYLLNSFMNK